MAFTLDEATGTAPATQTTRPTAVAGVVTAGPDADDLIRVVAPSFSGARDHEATYTAPASPSAGDVCVLVFVDGGDPIAVLPGIGGSGDITLADLTAHAADTTAVHGITDTSLLATASDIAGRQPLDSDLTAIAALSTTSYGRALLALADAAALRTAAGLVIGTDVQAQDAELAALAGLSSAADRLPYFTGSGAASLATFTSAARSLLDDTTVAAMRTTLGEPPVAASSLRIAFGSANGTTPSLAFSSGCSGIARTGGGGASGDYTITFSPTFGSASVLCIGNLVGASGEMQGVSSTSSTARILTENNSGTLVNANFWFIAMGVA